MRRCGTDVFTPSRAVSLLSPWRDTPSSRAAAATPPLDRASAARTYRSSKSRRASDSVSRAATALARVRCDGRPCAPITPREGPVTMIEASTFCSSRTFPGQS